VSFRVGDALGGPTRQTACRRGPWDRPAFTLSWVGGRVEDAASVARATAVAVDVVDGEAPSGRSRDRTYDRCGSRRRCPPSTCEIRRPGPEGAAGRTGRPPRPGRLGLDRLRGRRVAGRSGADANQNPALRGLLRRAGYAGAPRTRSARSPTAHRLRHRRGSGTRGCPAAARPSSCVPTSGGWWPAATSLISQRCLTATCRPRTTTSNAACTGYWTVSPRNFARPATSSLRGRPRSGGREPAASGQLPSTVTTSALCTVLT